MSLLNLILCCRRTRTSTKVISLGCLSLSRANNSTPSCKKKTHIDSINKWLSAFAVYCTVLLTSFPHRAVCLPRDNPIITLQVHRVCVAILGHFFPQERAGNLALNWGEQDIQLYLLKCTGQAKSSCPICGSGDHFSHGCSLSALRPTSTRGGVCHNFNRGTKCSQDPCSFNHYCKICDGDHPSFRNYFDNARPYRPQKCPLSLQPIVGCPGMASQKLP